MAEDAVEGKTVKQLAREFAALAKAGKGDFVVMTAGCDCTGFAGDVTVSTSSRKTVVIGRAD